MENPVIFGTNIHLVCHLPNDTTCCNDYRKWNVGHQYNLIITNGTSYNRSKYKEDLIVNDRKSVLTIFSFSETDVNIPYYCTYGFYVYQSVLELNKHAFECKYLRPNLFCSLYLLIINRFIKATTKRIVDHCFSGLNSFFVSLCVFIACVKVTLYMGDFT